MWFFEFWNFASHKGKWVCNIKKCMDFDKYSPLMQTSSLDFLFFFFHVFAQNSTETEFLYREGLFVQNSTGTNYFYRIAHKRIICSEQYRDGVDRDLCTTLMNLCRSVYDTHWYCFADYSFWKGRNFKRGFKFFERGRILIAASSFWEGNNSLCGLEFWSKGLHKFNRLLKQARIYIDLCTAIEDLYRSVYDTHGFV